MMSFDPYSSCHLKGKGYGCCNVYFGEMLNKITLFVNSWVHVLTFYINNLVAWCSEIF